MNKTQKSLSDSAPFTSKSDDPALDDNNLRSTVIKSKYYHGTSTDKSMIRNPEHTDHVSSHQKDLARGQANLQLKSSSTRKAKESAPRPPPSHKRTHSTSLTSRKGLTPPSRPSSTIRPPLRTTLAPRPLTATKMSPPTLRPLLCPTPVHAPPAPHPPAQRPAGSTIQGQAPPQTHLHMLHSLQRCPEIIPFDWNRLRPGHQDLGHNLQYADPPRKDEDKAFK